MIRLIQRHPVASYFVLAFAVSWGGILAIVLPTTFPAPVGEAERLFLAVYIAMLAGPSIAGLSMTALLDGRRGLREYDARLSAWRAGPSWYVVALLTAPVAMAVALALVSLVSDAYTPAVLSGAGATAGLLPTRSALAFVLTGLLIGAGAGFYEELGWSGFAVPRLLVRRDVASTGIVVGLAWGAWHSLAILWGSGNAVGAVAVPVYLVVALFSFLVPYRILMTWVYAHTKSTLVAVLMHASLTTSMLVLGASVSGVELLAFDLTFGAVLWSGVALMLAARDRQPASAPGRAGYSAGVT